MQAKKRICHNTISTFYPLTPMSHFSPFAYWDKAYKTNYSSYSIVQKATASQFFTEYT